MIKRQTLNNIITSNNIEFKRINEGLLKGNTTSTGMNFDVFLCHASKDIEEIKKIKAYLKEIKNKIAYVCELDDPQLDSQRANKNTANTLKYRMNNSKELYFVLSKNSQSSTWMPWELGYFDGIKKGHISILPIIDSFSREVTSFEGHEYLKLYPEVNI